MHLTASDLQGYFRPSECRLRVFLRARGEKEAGPSPYEEVLARLGERHEKAHLNTLGEFVDLKATEMPARITRTREEVDRRAQVIYQPALQASVTLNGVTCEVVGIPDFLILSADRGYAIRDSKLARRINAKDHPEILLQLQLYGWLYEQSFASPPRRLEVHSGTQEIVPVEYDGGGSALDTLGEIVSIKILAGEPYSPVGWTKCGGCGFHDRCWPQAEARRDVALVQGVDQGLALELHGQGVRTYDKLIEQFDESALSNLKRPAGTQLRKVGTAASRILRMAKVLVANKELVLNTPQIPDSADYLMFDIEGLPPHLDELDKIYLWGLQAFGKNPSEYFGITAGFGPEGDKAGWQEFLRVAGVIFRKYGDIRFVHWHHYERVHLDTYVQRYGDPDGTAARIAASLFDLLPATQKSIALPLPSYSLKVVEHYIGFSRSQDEFGGEWSMAKYIEATESNDEAERAKVMDAIRTYNREDLAATWAVFQWLKTKRP